MSIQTRKPPLGYPGRTLLTGASGFLGRAIVARARQQGLPLRCTSRRRPVLNHAADFVAADLCQPGAVAPLMQHVDCVIHAAGLAHQFGASDATAARFEQQNATATQHVMEAAVAAGVPRVVLVSSVSVYGNGAGRPVDESADCDPRGPYAISKWNAERTAIALADRGGIQLTVLRLATLYGAGDPGNVGRLIRAIARRRFINVGDGRNKKSLLHVTDAARACWLAAADADEARAHRIYNVTAEPVTMQQVIQEICRCLQRRSPTLALPPAAIIAAAACGRRLLIARTLAQRVDALVRKWTADDCYAGERFAETYRFQPQVALAAGISDEVAWIQNPSLEKRAA